MKLRAPQVASFARPAGETACPTNRAAQQQMSKLQSRLKAGCGQNCPPYKDSERGQFQIL